MRILRWLGAGLMRVSKGIRVAQLLEGAMIAGLGKPRAERMALIDAAKGEAMALCKTDRERAVVMLRTMEKRLFSAVMTKAGADEIGDLRALIAATAYDDSDQKMSVLGIADRYISGQPEQLE